LTKIWEIYIILIGIGRDRKKKDKMTNLKEELQKIEFLGKKFDIEESTYGENKFYGYNLSLKSGLWRVNVEHRNSKNQFETINLYLNERLVIKDRYISYDYTSESDMLNALKNVLEVFYKYIKEIEDYYTNIFNTTK